MKDVAFEELKGIVEYMYKGEVNVMQERLDSFLKTASSLQIKGLADQDGGKGEDREEDPGGGRIKRKTAPDLRGGYGESSPMPEEPPRSPKRRRRPRPVSQDDSLPAQDQNHCDTTTAPAFSQLQQQEVVMPTPLVPVKKTEPVDNSMVHLKTEIPDDVPQVDVQDLTLDDDEDFNNEDITQPGTSFSETSQDFAQWQQQMATQSGPADESFMAATQGINQSGSQDKKQFECQNCYDKFTSEKALERHKESCIVEYVCERCDFVTEDVKEFEEHESKDHLCVPKIEIDDEVKDDTKRNEEEPTIDENSSVDVVVKTDDKEADDEVMDLTEDNSDKAVFDLTGDDNDGNVTAAKASSSDIREGSGVFVCEMCPSDKTRRNTKQFEDHLRRFHKFRGSILKCDSCIFFTDNRAHLVDHYKSVHAKMLLLCDLCLGIFRSLDVLVKHYLYRHNKFKCPICTCITDFEADLRKHMSDEHNSEHGIIALNDKQNRKDKESLRSNKSSAVIHTIYLQNQDSGSTDKNVSIRKESKRSSGRENCEQSASDIQTSSTEPSVAETTNSPLINVTVASTSSTLPSASQIRIVLSTTATIPSPVKSTSSQTLSSANLAVPSTSPNQPLTKPNQTILPATSLPSAAPWTLTVAPRLLLSKSSRTSPQSSLPSTSAQPQHAISPSNLNPPSTSLVVHDPNSFPRSAETDNSVLKNALCKPSSYLPINLPSRKPISAGVPSTKQSLVVQPSVSNVLPQMRISNQIPSAAPTALTYSLQQNTLTSAPSYVAVPVSTSTPQMILSTPASSLNSIQSSNSVISQLQQNASQTVATLSAASCGLPSNASSGAPVFLAAEVRSSHSQILLPSVSTQPFVNQTPANNNILQIQPSSNASKSQFLTVKSWELLPQNSLGQNGNQPMVLQQCVQSDNPLNRPSVDANQQQSLVMHQTVANPSGTPLYSNYQYSSTLANQSIVTPTSYPNQIQLVIPEQRTAPKIQIRSVQSTMSLSSQPALPMHDLGFKAANSTHYCSSCPRVFNSSSALTYHERTQHGPNTNAN